LLSGLVPPPPTSCSGLGCVHYVKSS
jgi:hypothetical protein